MYDHGCENVHEDILKLYKANGIQQDVRYLLFLSLHFESFVLTAFISQISFHLQCEIVWNQYKLNHFILDSLTLVSGYFQNCLCCFSVSLLPPMQKLKAHLIGLDMYVFCAVSWWESPLLLIVLLPRVVLLFLLQNTLSPNLLSIKSKR